MSAPAVGEPRRFTAAAPAKLNLGLRIVGRRDDGYHELESVFVPLDLADEVAVEVAPGGAPVATLTLAGDAAGVPAGGANLAARAAQAFFEAAGLPGAAALRLTKRIPVAAGLGGGSSDAGAVLRALARLWPGALPAPALTDLALRLGADVPFFLDPRPARVSGIGERLRPLPGLPSLALLLAHPGVRLSTAEVYRAFDALHPALTTHTARSRLLPDARAGDGGASAAIVARHLGNDLEAAAVRLCPPIARLRERIRAMHPLGVGMSGSGPTVFGLFPSPEEAQAALARASFEAPIWARVALSVGSG